MTRRRRSKRRRDDVQEEGVVAVEQKEESSDQQCWETSSSHRWGHRGPGCQNLATSLAGLVTRDAGRQEPTVGA